MAHSINIINIPVALGIKATVSQPYMRFSLINFKDLSIYSSAARTQDNQIKQETTKFEQAAIWHGDVLNTIIKA